MSRMISSASIRMLDTSAISLSDSAIMAAGHDDGLSHEHNWARDIVAERRAYPTVAHAAAIRTPSSVVHDDIHYA